MMVEHVRQKIGGVICAPLLDENRTLNIITLVIDWEKELAESIQVDANGERSFNLSLARSKAFLQATREKIEANSGIHPMPPIVVNEIARPFVKALISRISPATMILSHSEIPSRMRTRAIDVVSYVD
jgi:flagellar biosynthesis protein FlhA